MIFSLSLLVSLSLASVSPLIGADKYYAGIGDRLAHGPVTVAGAAMGSLRSLPVTVDQALSGVHLHADDDDDDDDQNQRKWMPLGAELATELLGQAGCHPKLGTAHVRNVEGTATLSKEYPQIMFFGPTGRIVGTGAVMFEFAEASAEGWLSPHGYVSATLNAVPVLVLTATFLDEPCSENPTFSNIVASEHKSTVVPLGDRLIVSNHNDAQRRVMPVTLDDALTAGFVQGSCFKQMGQHVALFLDDAGNVMTTPNRKAKSLFPVVLMYGGGVLSTYFFTIPEPQFSHLWVAAADTNSWDVAAFTPHLFCKNFCDEDCDFDNDYFSTMHHYLRDVDEVDCSVSTTVRGDPEHRVFAGKMTQVLFRDSNGESYVEMWDSCGISCCQKDSNGDLSDYYRPNFGQTEDYVKNAHRAFGMPAGDPTPYFGVSISSEGIQGSPVFRAEEDGSGDDSSASTTMTVLAVVLGVLLALTCCCAAGLAGLLVMNRARASQTQAAHAGASHGHGIKRTNSRRQSGRY
jgi:hypothetical protein